MQQCPRGNRGPRIISGLGSARRSDFAQPSLYDQACYVSDVEAIAACHHLRESTGIGLGGSSGAVIAAAARYLRENPDTGAVVCVCPDGADRYEDSIYNSRWLSEKGIDLSSHRPSNFEEAVLA